MLFTRLHVSGRNIPGSRIANQTHTRLSPSSSSSAMSGTPSSDSNFHDRLHQFSSYIRDDDDVASSASRPPTSFSRKNLSATTPRHIPSSNNSSRSNISPFGKTPPSILAGSPTVKLIFEKSQVIYLINPESGVEGFIFVLLLK